MRQMIRKNHMDIAWHEYTDENGGNIPVTQASLWYRSVACQKLYEYTCGSDENYLYGRYWADVH